jgi:hypothetical protein
VNLRDELLISQAHRVLCDPSILGDIARARLKALRDVKGLTQSPLITPAPSQKLYSKHWFARVETSLFSTGTSISDKLDLIKIPCPRPADFPLSHVIPVETFHEILPHLVNKGWKWVSDIADATGLKIKNRLLLDIPRNSQWWEILSKAVTKTDGVHLVRPVSPLPNNPLFPTFTHPKDMIGFIPASLPRELDEPLRFAPASEGYIVKIKKSYRNDEDEEMCDITTFEPSRSYQKLRDNKGIYRKVIGNPTLLVLKENNIIAERAKNIIAIPHTLIYLTNHRNTKLTGALITNDHTIRTTERSISGILTIEQFQAIQDSVTNHFTLNDEGEVISDGELDNLDTCHTCGVGGKLRHCDLSTTCSGWFHRQCLGAEPGLDILPWSCKGCKNSVEHMKNHSMDPQPLDAQTELPRLYSGLYSAGDGSVRPKSYGKEASSTWGLVLLSPPGKAIMRSGHIEMIPGEESSLRAELEALIVLYQLLPPNVSARHSCDNQTAIDLHNNIEYITDMKSRKLLRIPYFSTLLRLDMAITSRGGGKIQIQHVLSHLEDSDCDDVDLKNRRYALCLADKAANEAHNLPIAPHDPSGDAPFSILHPNGLPFQKRASPWLRSRYAKKRAGLLFKLKSQGEILHSANTPPWEPGNLPDHLVILRNKLILQVLPTRAYRNKRGDSHLEGSIVSPQCPTCPLSDTDNSDLSPLETNAHFLTDCQISVNSRWKLRASDNLIVRGFCDFGFTRNRDSRIAIENEKIKIMLRDTADIELGPSWVHYKTDKHGRKTVTERGEQRIIKTSFPYKSMRTDWYYRTFTDMNRTIDSESIMSTTPEAVLDPIFINACATLFKAKAVFSSLPNIPHISCISDQVKSIANIATCLSHLDPILVDMSHLSEYDIDEVKSFLQSCTNPLLIIADHQLEWSSLDIFLAILPNELQILTPRYWEGNEKASLTTTYSRNLFLHASRGLLSEKQYLEYGEALENRTLIQKPQRHRFTQCTTEIGELTSIIPRSISDSFERSNNHPIKHLATLIGLFSLAQMDALKDQGVPIRFLPCIYRKLTRNHLEYQHENWITRNNSVRDKDKIIADAIHRNRPVNQTPTTAQKTTGSTPNRRITDRAKKWHQERNEVIERKKRWRQWTNDTAQLSPLVITPHTIDDPMLPLPSTPDDSLEDQATIACVPGAAVPPLGDENTFPDLSETEDEENLPHRKKICVKPPLNVKKRKRREPNSSDLSTAHQPKPKRGKQNDLTVKAHQRDIRSFFSLSKGGDQNHPT